MKVYAIIAGLILSLAAGLYWSLSALTESKVKLRATQVQVLSLEALLRASEERTARIQVQVQRTTLESNRNRQEVQRALRVNQDWSSTTVPADVVAGLCQSTKCTSPETTPVR
jgi:hypothetical protein